MSLEIFALISGMLPKIPAHLPEYSIQKVHTKLQTTFQNKKRTIKYVF